MGGKEDSGDPVVVDLDLDDIDEVDDEPEDDPALANGSDVHDVDALDRELDRERAASSVQAAAELLLARNRSSTEPDAQGIGERADARDLPIIRTDDRLGLRKR